MRYALVVLMMLVTTAGAAPTKAEVDAFTKQMGASLDEVLGTQAQAEAAEKANKHEEAERLWTGVYQGATMLRDHAKRAAAAGMFQDPMKFPTKKAGTLTAKQYLAKADALAAHGDVRAAKSSIAATNERAAKQKRTFVQGSATIATMLVKQLATAKGQPISKAAGTRIALDGIEKSAKALATSVTGAEQAGRAPKNATYPVSPKPIPAATLAKQMLALAADAKAARAELDKKAPVARPAAVARTTTTKSAPARTNAGGAGGGASQPQPAGEPTPAAEPVCETGNINCESGDTPCCAGERCLPAGWIMVGDKYEADYYACQDPDLAPKL